MTGIEDEIDQAWHPLDGVPPPILCPERWTGEWVGYRLCHALKVLARSPMPKGPKAFGSAMPAYEYDWADLIAQSETKPGEDELSEAERQRRAQRNSVRLPPSARELALMEEALLWPGRYLRGLPDILPGFTLASALTIWAEAAAREVGFDLLLHARFRRIAPEVASFMARQAMEIIAAGLRRDHVGVQ